MIPTSAPAAAAVAVVPCESYEVRTVARTIEEIAELLPDFAAPATNNAEVLLKINLEDLKPPEAATTTHPSVVLALGKILKARGASVIIGEGSGSSAWPLWRKVRRMAFDALKNTMKGKPYPELIAMYEAVLEAKLFEDIFALEIPGMRQPIIRTDQMGIDSEVDFYVQAGIRDAAEAIGARLSYFDIEKFNEVRSQPGLFLPVFHLCSVVARASRVISMPKFTPGDTNGFRGAVANFIGAVPTALREPYLTTSRIAAMSPELYLDIFSAITPRPWGLIDAVEAAGTNGLQWHPRMLIASCDCVAADAVAAMIAGREPFDVPVIRLASEHHQGIAERSAIDIRGMTLAQARSRMGGVSP
jgi:uncharacterized protein (DUF362 family)